MKGQSLISILIVFLSFGTRAQTVIEITDSTFKINGSILNSSSPENIRRLLGPPSRIDSAQNQRHIEYFPINEGDAHRSEIRLVTDYYYIYDDLGLVFYTANAAWSKNQPEILYIDFGNKREFDHDNFPDIIEEKFRPSKPFHGSVTINSIPIDPLKPLKGEKVAYDTEEFNLYGLTFAPTSRAMVVDRVYSRSGLCSIDLFFNNSTKNYLSYILLRYPTED